MPYNFDHGDTTVGLAGDWHGNLLWADKALRELARLGVTTVYHLGDFGIWPGPSGKRYITQVAVLCEALGITLVVTPGNHEDWDRIDALHTHREGPVEIAAHIWLLPRGYRWTHAGRSFVSLGGAPSIDYEYRTLNRDWWLGEQIPVDVAEQVAAAGHAEIMLAHDAGSVCVPKVAKIIGGNPFGWSDSARQYADEGRKRIDTAYNGVKPRLYAHGHYHVVDDAYGPDDERLLSLHQDGQAGNLVTLDLTQPDFGVTWVTFQTGTVASRRTIGLPAGYGDTYKGRD